jgi:hypothetical protein
MAAWNARAVQQAGWRDAQMPLWITCRPVRIVDRVGEHTGCT